MVVEEGNGSQLAAIEREKQADRETILQIQSLSIFLDLETCDSNLISPPDFV
jgi:hypothetical protein